MTTATWKALRAGLRPSRRKMLFSRVRNLPFERNTLPPHTLNIAMIPKLKVLGGLVLALAGASATNAKDLKLLNVSYDPTRELYTEFNAAFAKYWQGKTGEVVTVNQSHGGSGKQARAVID